MENLLPQVVLNTLLQHLQIDAQVEQQTRDDKSTVLVIKSPEANLLVSSQGGQVDNLQILASRIVEHAYKTKGLPERPPLVSVEVEGHRELKENQLLEKARQAMESVLRWKEPFDLDPMNSYERRLVHQEVQKNPELTSISLEDPEGQGRLKSVRILLKEHADKYGK